MEAFRMKLDALGAIGKAVREQCGDYELSCFVPSCS